MTKYYAGIGSRSTPTDVLQLMAKLAAWLSTEGFTLRSGHAEGADLAFEEGADGNAQVFTPWASFNSEFPVIGEHHLAPRGWTFPIAKQAHPAWDRCKQGAQKLHARNVHQVLGPDEGGTPSSFVLCWTPEGSGKGGTGQAIRIAEANGIPVFDLGLPAVRERLEAKLDALPKCPECGESPGNCYRICPTQDPYHGDQLAEHMDHEFNARWDDNNERYAAETIGLEG